MNLLTKKIEHFEKHRKRRPRFILVDHETFRVIRGQSNERPRWVYTDHGYRIGLPVDGVLVIPTVTVTGVGECEQGLTLMEEA